MFGATTSKIRKVNTWTLDDLATSVLLCKRKDSFQPNSAHIHNPDSLSDHTAFATKHHYIGNDQDLGEQNWTSRNVHLTSCSFKSTVAPDSTLGEKIARYIPTHSDDTQSPTIVQISELQQPKDGDRFTVDILKQTSIDSCVAGKVINPPRRMGVQVTEDEPAEGVDAPSTTEAADGDGDGDDVGGGSSGAGGGVGGGDGDGGGGAAQPAFDPATYAAQLSRAEICYLFECNDIHLKFGTKKGQTAAARKALLEKLDEGKVANKLSKSVIQIMMKKNNRKGATVYVMKNSCSNPKDTCPVPLLS